MEKGSILKLLFLVTKKKIKKIPKVAVQIF